MRTTRRWISALIIGALLILATAMPAFAIVDGFVPTDLPDAGGGIQAKDNGGVGAGNPAGVEPLIPLNNPGKGNPSPGGPS